MDLGQSYSGMDMLLTEVGKAMVEVWGNISSVSVLDTLSYTYIFEIQVEIASRQFDV